VLLKAAWPVIAGAAVATGPVGVVVVDVGVVVVDVVVVGFVVVGVVVVVAIGGGGDAGNAANVTVVDGDAGGDGVPGAPPSEDPMRTRRDVALRDPARLRAITTATTVAPARIAETRRWPDLAPGRSWQPAPATAHTRHRYENRDGPRCQRPRVTRSSNPGTA
jgi:hypothetical protein